MALRSLWDGSRLRRLISETRSFESEKFNVVATLVQFSSLCILSPDPESVDAALCVPALCPHLFCSIHIRPSWKRCFARVLLLLSESESCVTPFAAPSRPASLLCFEMAPSVTTGALFPSKLALEQAIEARAAIDRSLSEIPAKVKLE